MNCVDAVKSAGDRLVVERLLQRRGRLYADIWKVGINVGLRISDLLALEFAPVMAALPSRELVLTEQKTGKRKGLRLNPTAVRVIEKRRADYPDHRWLFEVACRRAHGKPISRCTVARVFKEVGEQIGLKLSTHSMRKTRGYALYDAGVPLEMIAKVLNHSSPAVTMAYIGITQQQILETYEAYEL